MRKLGLLVVLAAGMLLPTCSRATTITFNAAPGGVLSFTPGVGNQLSIFDVVITSVTVDSTTYAVTGGSLALLTAPETFDTGTNPVQALFGAGGDLAINGEIPTLGLNSVSSLLSGGFLAGSGAQLSTTSDGYFQGYLDSNTLSINAALTGGPLESGQVTALVCSQGGGSTFCSNFSGTSYFGVAVTSTNVNAPEPSTIALLLAGLLFLPIYSKLGVRFSA